MQQFGNGRHERRNRATVAAGFVTGMLAAILARGDRDRDLVLHLLEQSGIPPEILNDPGLRIGVNRYADFYNRLVNALDDEAFGLFAVPLRRGGFEFLCRGVLSAATLSEALDRSSRFLHLALPELQLVVRRAEDAGALLAITATAGSSIARRPPTDPARIFAFEWLLRLVHALLCWLAGRAIALDSVRFPYPRPDHATDYALIYTADSRFDAAGAGLEAHFRADLLDLPIRRDEAALAAFLRGAPGRIALLYRRDREMVQRVRDLLRQSLPTLPAATEIARRFHLSERSLHRRLAEEGANFRSIRDALRRDLALNRLANSDRPLATIAAELGFSEPSAFYRAVVGWTGSSPSAYRRASRPARLGSGMTGGAATASTDIGSPET